ncbi:hypothetical protein Taro_027823 [Colocasia esculenta]|uniref:Uncharacterized protein n=1 Tax=Colocasia esculenta TaxID=4460 RepID=A0A843VPY9_COLES|nr:hypothetical protein [Colocasia esculenta]
MPVSVAFSKREPEVYTVLVMDGVDTSIDDVDTGSLFLELFHEDRVQCVDIAPGSVDTRPSSQETQFHSALGWSRCALVLEPWCSRACEFAEFTSGLWSRCIQFLSLMVSTHPLMCVDTAPGSVDTRPSSQETQLPDWDRVSTQSLHPTQDKALSILEEGKKSGKKGSASRGAEQCRQGKKKEKKRRSS